MEDHRRVTSWWFVAMLAIPGCGQVRCVVPLVGEVGDHDDEVVPTTAVRLPLGSAWAHRTLEQMIGPDDPDALVIETAARPIVGARYADVVAAMGERVPGTSCTGTETNGHCRDVLVDLFYTAGLVDGAPLDVLVFDAHDPVTNRDTGVVREFIVEIPAEQVAPDAVYAMVRRKLGPPLRHHGQMTMEWDRGVRRLLVASSLGNLTIDVSLRDEHSTSLTSTMFDDTPDPACRRALAIYEAYTQCTAIDLHARTLDLLESTLELPDRTARCERQSARFADAMTAAHCAVPPNRP